MLYDDELYMLKSNKIYVMLCYVMLLFFWLIIHYSKRDPYLPPLAPPTHSVAAQMLQQQDVPFESVQKMELICDQESLWYLSVGESERVLLRVN